MNNLAPKSLTAGPYKPTQPLTGSPDPALFRLSNMIVRGRDNDIYAENYAGSLNLSETIPPLSLTGTLAKTIGSTVITGTGTLFIAELHLGQFIFAGTELLVCDSVTDNTHFVASQPALSSASGLTGVMMTIAFAMNDRRGTLSRGNAVIFDKGNIFAVGEGVLRLNGAVLPGVSLTAKKQSQVAVYNSGSNTYTIFTLGMPTPATSPTIADIAGGTQNMQAGVYSIRLVPARVATGGYNNPGPPVLFTLATNGDQAEVDMTAVPFDTASGQDAWDVYGTLFQAVVKGIGPWYFIKTVTAADYTANKFRIEWSDAQINGGANILEYDDNAPRDAEFIGVLGGDPVYISCEGPGATSPGPLVIPTKPVNIEAAPLINAVPLSPPEVILGFISVLGRLYLMTVNTLQIVEATGLASPPLYSRSFWKAGFKNPYQIVFVNGTLYGYTAQGPTRSQTTTTEASEEHAFAADFVSIYSTWDAARVLVGYDPKNNAVCFFHCADSLNAQGFWRTRVLMFGLQQDALIGDIYITDPVRDMIVSGIATVGSNLDFVAGGRTSTVPTIDTWRFDQISGVAIPWYEAWGFTDSGIETRDKTIKSVKATGRTNSGSIGIFGAQPTQSIPVTALETGNAGSLTGAIAIPDAATVTQTQRIQLNVPNLSVWTARYEGIYPGSGPLNRVDEIVIELAQSGVRR